MTTRSQSRLNLFRAAKGEVTLVMEPSFPPSPHSQDIGSSSRTNERKDPSIPEIPSPTGCFKADANTFDKGLPNGEFQRQMVATQNRFMQDMNANMNDITANMAALLK